MAASQHRVSLALACHVFYSAGSAIAIIGVESTGAPGTGAPLYYFLRACVITKHSSSLYIGMAKVLPIIDVLGYDGQNFSFSSSPSPSPRSDSTPITQAESHIST